MKECTGWQSTRQQCVGKELCC